MENTAAPPGGFPAPAHRRANVRADAVDTPDRAAGGGPARVIYRLGNRSRSPIRAPSGLRRVVHRHAGRIDRPRQRFAVDARPQAADVAVERIEPDADVLERLPF